MGAFTLITDSACDLPAQTLRSDDVRIVGLPFVLDGEPGVYHRDDFPTRDFYAMQRTGKTFTTSPASIDDYRSVFESELRAGNDVLYIGVSSGLSKTCDAARHAARALAGEYPGSRVYAPDTYCGSAGLGLVVDMAIRHKRRGATFDEVSALVRRTSPRVCHWLTVNDLSHLRRSGRVGAGALAGGSSRDTKSILFANDDGRLVCDSKVRGRARSLEALAEKYLAHAEDPRGGAVYISHAGCPEDAGVLDGLLSMLCGHRADLVTEMSPLIGAHTGPGAVALFFIGRHR